MLSSAKHPAKQRPSAATRHSTGGGTGGSWASRAIAVLKDAHSRGHEALGAAEAELLAKLRDLHTAGFSPRPCSVEWKLQAARHAHTIEHDRRVTCPEPRGQLA